MLHLPMIIHLTKFLIYFFPLNSNPLVGNHVEYIYHVFELKKILQFTLNIPFVYPYEKSRQNYFTP